MSRIQTATIFGSLSLSVYLLLTGLAAVVLGHSLVLSALLVPLSLLEDMSSSVFERSAFGRDLLSVFSLWLTFVCVLDLSMLFSSSDVADPIRSAYANSYTKRLVTGLRPRLAR